ncbi:MAG: TetR/AcrR family transcriptional regulator [Syntrophales bacterium]|jgi:AcrR family transcriptional regulator|nr:TetR/AcrR family transcriptional regulator [Syntrophales bacterium]MCK9527921.1 TetR/AcrR family transcriptional regulator [Syntrophales bacterium]MDX9921903.1 TetR/AcrR family transcriptional regulator [Syntrophales bacterium]
MRYTDKRCDIMEAALELIAEHGFHGAPMSDIAEKAGVAAGTIYRYFESKDILINELNQELETIVSSLLLEEFPEGGTVQERFCHVVRALFRYFIDHPLQFRFMEQYSYSPYGVSRRRDKLLGIRGDADRQLFRMAIEEGVAEATLKNFPVMVLCGLAFGPMVSLVRDHILGFIHLDDVLIDRITEACWDAVKR